MLSMSIILAARNAGHPIIKTKMFDFKGSHSDWLASEYSERASQSECVPQSQTFFMLSWPAILTVSIFARKIIFIVYCLSLSLNIIFGHVTISLKNKIEKYD